MKTFKWHDARKEKPSLNLIGYSELIIVEYKVYEEDESVNCIKYCTLGYYKEKSNGLISNELILFEQGDARYINWGNIDYWSYIPTKADTKELTERIDNIARFLDVFSDGCRDCPLRNKCLYDAEWNELDCKDSIVKYLRGD